MKQLAKFGDAIKEAFKKGRAEIEILRDNIADLKAERRNVESLPNDVETIMAQVDGIITRTVMSHPIAPHCLNSTGEIRGGDLMEYFTGVYSPATGSPTRLFEVLCHFFPDRLKEVLREGAPKHGISEVDRTARLAKIDRDLFIAEIAEEIACREFEANAAAVIDRRADANPAILLAPDAELMRVA